MTLAKGQGSSRHKGKEIASNDTATRDVGEEAAHSESDRSDEEEAWHNLDSKCAPFIDPWYDTHAYLLKSLASTLCRAVCGLPFAITTWIYLGLCWLLQF